MCVVDAIDAHKRHAPTLFMQIMTLVHKFLIYEFLILASWCCFLRSPHQCPSGSALKTDRREVPGSIPGRACRPSCLEFYVVFSETRVYSG